MQVLFLLSTLLFAQIQPFEYVERYNQESESPHSVWAQVTLYYSSPEEIRPEILNAIRSDLVRSGIESSSSLPEAVIAINRGLMDESLLLFTLLLEGDEDIRRDYVSEFYRERDPDDELKFIIEAAIDGKELSADEVDVTEFRFHQLLMFYYTNNNKIVDDGLLSAYVNYWEQRFERVNYSPFIYELFKVTLSKAAYDIDRYNVMSRIFSDDFELNYIPPSNLKRNILWGVDFAFYRQGLLDKAIEIQQAYTLPLIEYIGDTNGRLYTLNQQGAYLIDLGNFQRARVVYEELLENIDSFSSGGKIAVYNNLSIIYFNTGETDAYVDTQLMALELARNTGNTNYQDEIYRNLHIFYRKYRNWDLARQYLDQAEILANENANKSALISIYISRAIFDNDYLNNDDQALHHLDIAESLVDENTDYRLLQRIYRTKSEIYSSEGNWNESLELLQNNLETSTSNNNTVNYLDTIADLARVNIELGNIQNAARLIAEFKTYDTSVLPFRTLVYAQTVESTIASLNGGENLANTNFSELINAVFERARNTSDIETGYWNLEREYTFLFETYADFLIGRGKFEQAVNLLDRVRTINDASLTDSPLVQAGRLNEEELLTEKNLSSEMDRLRRQFITTSGQERLAIKNQIEQLSAQRRSLFRQYSSAPDYKEVKLWTIRRRLKPGQVLFHVTEINSHYYIATISRDQSDIVKLEIRDGDRELFEEALESIITGKTNLEQFYEISRFLNFDRFFDSHNSFILIPDGYLYQLPLAVMPVKQPDTPFSYGSTEYLVERADIYTVNSFKDFLHRDKNVTYSHDFAGFGVSDFKNEETGRRLVSLPRAPEEIEEITAGLTRFSGTIPMTNEAATTRGFREIAGSSRILHMATHSEVSDSDPLFSKLHFYADSETEGEEIVKGQLFAYELFDLNLQNELVMLNSCESGGDRYLQGTGIMGINRALRYAGVKSLVLNAWSVNDHYAADFAALFYSNLNEGFSKSESLQRAKIDFIKTKNANPHFWGPYILNGDNRPLLRRKDTGLANILLAAMFIIAVSVMAGKRRVGS